MSSVDISVIVPVYNRESLLAKCIESVICQKDISLEIIIIDDGSTDDTLRICKQYALHNSNIRVIHQDNQGISSARNTGLDVVAGEYITFLDSDDFIPHENAFKEMLYSIRQQNVDVVIGEYDIADEDGNYRGKGIIPKEYRSKIISSRQFWELNSRKDCNFLFTVVWGKLYKREVWNNLRFDIHGRFAEDEYVLSTLTEKCKNYFLLPETVYTQIVSDESLSRSSFNPNKLNSPDSKLKTCQYLINMGLYSCAVEKWGIAVGEIILMTRLASDFETINKIKKLHREVCRLGKKLFKHMDNKKKCKFIAYIVGYPVYSTYLLTKKG